MADPADLNVDELRRRARRRLVGAVVVALVAAVVVPMLLESDPKPLGESVAVKIPPVDDGRFVNRLTEGTTTRPADAAAAKTDPAPKDTRKPASDADNAIATPPAKPPKYDTQIAADKPVPAVPSATRAPEAKEPAPPKTAPKAEPRAEPKAEPKTEPRPEPKSESKGAAGVAASSAANGATRDGFSVQLAAFSDDKGANALANRLKLGGYPAYTEALKTSRGTLWRVRVGPYPTREAANGMRDKLKTEGQNGIVAPSR
ncbi:MAG: SPOR domain-containing protein [Casimicrobiaceae bacterium]